MPKTATAPTVSALPTEAELDALGEARRERLYRPGVRIARRCTFPGCGRREFHPSWDCKEHPGKTEVQCNNTYFGKPC